MKLLVFLLLLSVQSWAQIQNLRNPLILSGSLQKNSRDNSCSYLLVHSFATKKGQNFYQSGIAWVIGTSQRPYFLTPDHVIAGADVIVAQCYEQYFVLSVKGRSPTLDLALLESSEIPENIRSLIVWEDRTKYISKFSSDERLSLETLAPDHQDFENKVVAGLGDYHQTYSYNMHVIKNEMPFKFENLYLPARSWIQFGSGYVSELGLMFPGLGIRPGMSGAPMHIDSQDQRGNRTPYLVGMAYLTEKNGAQSALISLPAILKALPLLMASTKADADVFSEVSPNGPFLVNKSQLPGQEKVLTVYTEKSWRSFQQTCESPYQTSSEWGKNKTPLVNSPFMETLKKGPLQKLSPSEYQRVKKSIQELQKTKNPKLNQIKSLRGGDFGEGGGGTAVAYAESFAYSSQGTTEFGLQKWLPSSYKNISECRRSGIVDIQTGEFFDTLSIDGKLRKVDDLHRFKNLLMEYGPRVLKQTGLPITPKRTWKLRASEKSAYFPYAIDGVTNWYIHTKARAEASPGLPASQFFESSLSGNINIHLTTDQLDLQVQTNNAAIKGILRLNPKCEIDLTKNNVHKSNIWKTEIRDRKVKADIIISERPLLTIRILEAKKECLPEAFANGRLPTHYGPVTDPSTLWLYEAVFYE